MSARERVLELLPAKGERLEGGVTVAHLIDLTGYSAAYLNAILRDLARDQLARAVQPRGPDYHLFGPAPVWFRYFVDPPTPRSSGTPTWNGRRQVRRKH